MTETPQFDRRMLEALICPTTHTTLEYDSGRQELVSKKAKLAFPIRDGIPINRPGVFITSSIMLR